MSEYDAVEYLDFLANHFEFRDWNYTRDTDITSIRYVSSKDPSNKLGHRVKSAFRLSFGKPILPGLYDKNLFFRYRMFIHAIKGNKNLPDGSLDGGNVITFWEETGEYLQMVQPTVGALLVEFLKEEPDNPHAKKIINELERIQKGYSERIARGECGMPPSE